MTVTGRHACASLQVRHAVCDQLIRWAVGPLDRSVHPSVYRSVGRSVGWSVARLVVPTNGRSVGPVQKVDGPTDRLTDRLTNGQTERLADRLTSKLTEEPKVD